jgi:ATP-dependent Clp protease ATP-binding subunit ClpC
MNDRTTRREFVHNSLIVLGGAAIPCAIAGTNANAGGMVNQLQLVESVTFDHFTDRAREVMKLANTESIRSKHAFVATEHILVGLVKTEPGVALNVLKKFDVDLRKIRRVVEMIVGDGPGLQTTGTLSYTPRARNVIKYAIDEARKLDHDYVGTEHILLGLLCEPEGVGACVLIHLGLTPESVRQEVLSVFAQRDALASGDDRGR